MENYRWIIITGLAFLLALLWDLKTRDRNSKGSPTNFDLSFYFKDNWQRLLLSFIFSILLAVLFYMVSPEFFAVSTELTNWGILVYIAIGAAPDLIVGYAKRKTSFLRPEQVVLKGEVFTRK